MKIKRVVCFFVLMVSLLCLLAPAAVLAQEMEEQVSIEPTYRKLEATSPGASFEYEVALKYIGLEARDFDLAVTGPQDWTVYVKPQYGEQRIGSIRLEPFSASGNKVKVVAFPPLFLIPEPGEYSVTLEASAGDITDSVDLTAIITDTYALAVSPVEERLNTTATAGEDNIYSILVENSGSGALENIKLSSKKPSGWEIEFTPEEIDNLSTGGFQTIDVNIKPDPKTIAGDYEITLVADAKQATESIKVRVTVETPTVWGWVGVGIILVVVAGVIAVFVRFSRR